MIPETLPKYTLDMNEQAHGSKQNASEQRENYKTRPESCKPSLFIVFWSHTGIILAGQVYTLAQTRSEVRRKRVLHPTERYQTEMAANVGVLPVASIQVSPSVFYKISLIVPPLD